MGLFDLTSGWATWAPFTFIIRGVMGYIIGAVSHSNNKNGTSILYNLAAIIVSSLWMIAGYYIAEVILYGNLLSPVSSIPGNIAQIVVGLVISIPLSKILTRYIK